MGKMGDAFLAVFEALEGLTPEETERVLRAIAIFVEPDPEPPAEGGEGEGC